MYWQKDPTHQCLTKSISGTSKASASLDPSTNKVNNLSEIIKEHSCQHTWSCHD